FRRVLFRSPDPPHQHSCTPIHARPHHHETPDSRAELDAVCYTPFRYRGTTCHAVMPWLDAPCGSTQTGSNVRLQPSRPSLAPPSVRAIRPALKHSRSERIIAKEP